MTSKTLIFALGTLGSPVSTNVGLSNLPGTVVGESSSPSGIKDWNKNCVRV
jgi:hypothetical protein